MSAEDDFPLMDMKGLLAEAQELGIQYTGDDPVELHMLVQVTRAEKGRDVPVPCYGKSFDQTDRRCRICQLRDPCADLDKRPRIEVLEIKLQPIPCEACGKGLLEVECEDPDTGEIRDFGCTTPGCPNSVAVQCGWESVGEDMPREIVVGAVESEKDSSSSDSSETAQKSTHGTKEPGGASCETSAESQSDEATSAQAEKSAPSGPSSKPQLRVVKGGGGKKKKAKTTKKKDPKKRIVVKKKNDPPAPKPVVSPKPAQKPTGNDKPARLVFVVDGQSYKSLSAVTNAITGSRAWAASRFWGVVPSEAKRGDSFSREWKGQTYTVEVQ